ncbi:MAG: ABC transporter permease subunit [Nocardioidaceae bacterium]
MSSSATSAKEAVFDSSLGASLRRHSTAWLLVAVVTLWVIVWSITKGQDTLTISNSTLTGVHDWLKGRSDAYESSSSIIITVIQHVGDAFNSVIVWLQQTFTIGKFPRTVPQIGWFGLLAIAMWVAYAAAGGVSVILVTVSFLAFGALGFWGDSIDTLIVIVVAVACAVAIGIPLGVWMGHSKIVTAIVTPVLDVMQTMPSFVYLLPIVILFGIGNAAAVVVTLIYALPPVIRVTAFAIRNVPATTLEATASLGQSRWQRLKDVEIPMAKRTIIVGINQTTLAALSMVIIAAYVDGIGLGGPVLQGITRGQLGTSFVAGMCIVIMAIMLDRTTTAASMRSETAARAGRTKKKQRRLILVGGGVLTLVAIWLSNTRLQYNQFPESWDIGTPIREQVDKFGNWLVGDASKYTAQVQDKFTVWFLNPMQDLIANSPWYVAGIAICLIAYLIGKERALAAAVVCLGGIYFLDLWHNAMVTLTSVLVATAVVMVLAVIFGVWIGRSVVADRIIRPVLDAGQTLPAFVYLVPILILFGPNRFTAIVAGIIYAAPVSIKLVADGIRNVSPTTIEAAEAAGTSRFQMITKVQLPMARGSLLLAANQGLLYVLAMVVIGALVGAGGLGFDVVTGFRQADYIGRGMAAGIALVLIGIMLDRITTYGAARQGPGGKRAMAR